MIAEVRGEGLLLGLVCAATCRMATSSTALRNEKMLAIAAGDNVVRLLPPLIIDEVRVLPTASP